ncbi:hypothetical protein FH508_0008640 [Lysinibacillus sp. CD3-6]|uniref:hypothetical protein n=1 Tax=Lysinibacillus sp. CD3-6 TaxID=2892541 RepID=UPI001122C6DB|nr:hypothetical protein [Lysinibacillus sp. CD3-6]UED81947.1 hypothetical protein FH508_0008640 [Lysinibacillus sp. CD3-6]
MDKPLIAITNDVAWSLQQIHDLYMQGKIKGVTMQIALTDGEFATTHSGELSYLEKLGLIEAAKQDLLVSTLSEE